VGLLLSAVEGVEGGAGASVGVVEGVGVEVDEVLLDDEGGGVAFGGTFGAGLCENVFG